MTLFYMGFPRLEKFDIRSLRRQAKIAGTISCGPAQKRYPAQLSLTTLTCIFAAVQSGLVGIICEHHKLKMVSYAQHLGSM
ncbi:hypothetical protein SUGI_0956320 [Cryptomeria japonica]|nr:hypothetical protein SUGI_0956320 [Cryptomeria japonica]